MGEGGDGWGKGGLRSAFADDLAFTCYLAEIDFAVVAVPDAADEEFELLFIGCWGHCEGVFLFVVWRGEGWGDKVGRRWLCEVVSGLEQRGLVEG